MAAASAFRITKLVPDHSTAIMGGAHVTQVIEWAGTATFPITAYYIAKPGCSTDFSCGSGSRVFMTGTKTLIWEQMAYCIPPDSFGPSFTGKWSFYLVDAKGRRTPSVTWIFTCKAAA